MCSRLTCIFPSLKKEKKKKEKRGREKGVTTDRAEEIPAKNTASRRRALVAHILQAF